MVTRTEIKNKPLLQALLITALCLVSVIIFSILGGVLSILFFGINMNSLTNYSDPNTIAALKLFQLFSAIGLFIIPPIVFKYIVSKNPFHDLSFNKATQPFNYGLIIIFLVVSAPFLSWIVQLNLNMDLPDFLYGLENWMKESEANALELTKAFLKFDGLGSLLYGILIIALIPAIGEELLFRGVIQKIAIQWTKNPHWGIWLSAVLFSAFHLQFYGFFPRMLLGVVLGYVFFWSTNLWVPILGHFINNGSVVIFSFLYPETINETELTFFEDSDYKVIFYILSMVLSLLILYVFKKNNTEDKQNVSKLSS